MPDTATKSPEWANAYLNAKRGATLASEKEMVRLLALPIPESDRAGIGKRVKDFHKLVANAPVADLKQIEAKVGNNKSGLGSLYHLELSTGLRNDLLNRMRARIGKDDAGLNPVGRGINSSAKTVKGINTNPVSSRVGPSKTPSPDWIFVGPLAISFPSLDSVGRHQMSISGSVPDKTGAMAVVGKHLAKELKKINPRAFVEPVQLPDSSGQPQPSIRVSNVGGYELWMALATLQGEYFSDLAASRISKEDYDDRQQYKAWAEVLAEVGNNLLNRIPFSPPFTEFTDEGFEFTGFNNPLDLLTLVTSFSKLRALKEGEIRRRILGRLAGKAKDLKMLHNLIGASVDGKAWTNALKKLSNAEQSVLTQLEQAHAQVLTAIKEGQTEKAYQIVKKWRGPAEKLYESTRDIYWNDPKIRKQWKNAGADMSKNAPTLLVERIENGQVFYERQTITLEHLVRKTDNPFLAVSKDNLLHVLGYENSVILEDIRRAEKYSPAVWSSGDPVETLVRTIEKPE